MTGVGIAARDVGDHVAVPDGGDRVDQTGDDLDCQRAQPLGGAGCERLRHQPAESMMLSAVEAQDVGGRPVPERT